MSDKPPEPEEFEDGDIDLDGLLDDLEEEVIKTVVGSSGSSYQVWGDHEADWFNSNLAAYMEDYKFENVADMQDLDRLLAMELISYRYSNWLLRGKDYEGLLFEEKQIRESKDRVDKEIRLLKSHLGMARKARIESEQQSVADYLKRLLERGKEFGVHRDTQIMEAVNLWFELRTMIGLHDRTDEEERAHLGVSEHQIMEWLRDEAIPKFDEVDAAFRKNQKLWIQEVT